MAIDPAKLPASADSVTLPIGDFTTEAGVPVPGAELRLFAWYEGPVEETVLRPVILVELAGSAVGTAAVWAGMIGPGLALDTTRYLVLCANCLGGCQGSTGPSSTHPDGGYWGSRFPALSIRDLVTAEKQLLVDVLGVDRIPWCHRCVDGWCRVLEWTFMFPEVVEAALPIAVSARAAAWQIGIRSAQIRFITADPCWQNGDYGSGHILPRPRPGPTYRPPDLPW